MVLSQASMEWAFIKKKYLMDEHGDNIPVMKMIKRSIDQNNIMNPGKIFDLN